MIDLLWIVIISITVTIALLIANLYYAHKLSFLKRFLKRLRARKKEVITTLTWSTAIAIVAIKSYWLAYVNNPVLFEYSIAWTMVDQWAPKLSSLDLALILLFSMIAGAVMLDVEAILYSSIATVIISFIFPLVFSTLFIWYVLGYGNVLSVGGGFWVWGEYVVYFALKNILRMTFPLVYVICFVGSFMGAFIRGVLQPSAET